jgi:ribosomal-protein-serine acetyltransferase
MLTLPNENRCSSNQLYSVQIFTIFYCRVFYYIWPIRDYMTTIEAGDGISLELIDNRHADTTFALINDNRQQLRQWLPWVDKMKTIEAFTRFIDDCKKHAAGRSDFAYVILLDGVVAGRMGIYQIDYQNRTGFIGYWIGEAFSGKGIVTKACRALIDCCFDSLNLNRIEIRCGTENHKSRAIPERLHFKLEGIIRQAEYVNEVFIDLYCFSMLKEEW